MLFGQDRDELRKMYVDAWRKRVAGDVLTPLESQIAQVVEDHPEYHQYLTSGDVEADFSPDAGRSNPFLHMGLHLSIREQVATDRPPGIRAVFQSLCKTTGSHLEAEHQMLECLAETLWESQRNNAPPDEYKYLERLRRLN